MSDVMLCPVCKGERIIGQRHDSDWGGGNNTAWVNPDKCYEPGDQDTGGDINIFICLACEFTWQRYSPDPETILAIRENALRAGIALTQQRLEVACHVKADDKVSFDWAVLDELEKAREAMKQIQEIASLGLDQDDIGGTYQIEAIARAFLAEKR